VALLTGPQSTQGWGGFLFRWDQLPSDEWVFNAKSGADQTHILEFSASFTHEHGPGWDHMTASPTSVTALVGGPVPSPDVPQEKLDSLVRDAWAQMAEAIRNKPGHDQTRVAAYEMARDGEADRVTGVMYRGRLIAMTMGGTLLVVALVVEQRRKVFLGVTAAAIPSPR